MDEGGLGGSIPPEGKSSRSRATRIPRFTRTSAVADLHVPLRAGSDIVFLGGIINYVLAGEKYFRDYVVHYTNAATLVTEDFADTEDLGGVFSGLDREHRTYDFEAWRYQGAEVSAAAGDRDRPEEPEEPEDPEQDHGPAHREVRRAGRGEAHGAGGAAAHRDPDRDETLQHPRCVFQVLKRHFARYTPDMVEQACGVPAEVFERVCELVTDNSGPERTTALVYSVGWTQHTVGAQYIRTAAILQLLLGNIGRPGGGILALRGHASIQGSTDIPTLFDLLPGYLPMPHVHGNEDLATYLGAESMDKGFWADMGPYMVSLLKAWWGEAATPDNDFCYDYLPRLTGSHSTYQTVAAQISGDSPGYFLFGENPAVGSANGRMQRFGLAALDWLVVRDLVMIESATFWQNGPEIETGEMRTQDIKTEVFFLPAAAHTEKNGSLTNTQRMLQWHHEAVEPGEDARSDLWFAYHLGRRIREKLAASGDEMDRPVQDLTWGYPVEGPLAEPSAEAVLAEVNGWDADGKPRSERKALVWWDAAAGTWTGHDVADFIADRAPSYRPDADATGVAAISGVDPFILEADGKGWLFAPAGLVDGPLPAHYEPQESPFTNPLYGQQRNPVREIIRHPRNPLQPSGRELGSEVFPYVATTYRLTEHHTAGGMSRMLPYLSELQPEFFCEVSPLLAAERGLQNGGWATIVTARAAVEVRVLVTERIRPIEVQGRRLHQIGLPYHWGANGLSTGDSANDLAHLALDPNVHIQEVKAMACDIRPGRRPRGPALRELVREDARRAGITEATGTEVS